MKLLGKDYEVFVDDERYVRILEKTDILSWWEDATAMRVVASEREATEAAT